MTDTAKPKNGPAPGNDAAGPQVRVLGQYIKDLSFESPNVTKLLANPGEPPNLQVNVNVNAQRADQNVFESSIEMTAKALNNKGVVYELEIVYGGLFQVSGMPEVQLEQFLLINCPALLFPFVRRLVADVTREGGFPPLLLDPLDFAGLYMQRKREQAASGGDKPKIV